MISGIHLFKCEESVNQSNGIYVCVYKDGSMLFVCLLDLIGLLFSGWWFSAVFQYEVSYWLFLMLVCIATPLPPAVRRLFFFPKAALQYQYYHTIYGGTTSPHREQLAASRVGVWFFNVATGALPIVPYIACFEPRRPS